MWTIWKETNNQTFNDKEVNYSRIETWLLKRFVWVIPHQALMTQILFQILLIHCVFVPNVGILYILGVFYVHSQCA